MSWEKIFLFWEMPRFFNRIVFIQPFFNFLPVMLAMVLAQFYPKGNSFFMKKIYFHLGPCFASQRLVVAVTIFPQKKRVWLGNEPFFESNLWKIPNIAESWMPFACQIQWILEPPNGPQGP
jgi:hypothetical protein